MSTFTWHLSSKHEPRRGSRPTASSRRLDPLRLARQGDPVSRLLVLGSTTRLSGRPCMLFARPSPARATPRRRAQPDGDLTRYVIRLASDVWPSSKRPNGAPRPLPHPCRVDDEGQLSPSGPRPCGVPRDRRTSRALARRDHRLAGPSPKRATVPPRRGGRGQRDPTLTDHGPRRGRPRRARASPPTPLLGMQSHRQSPTPSPGPSTPTTTSTSTSGQRARDRRVSGPCGSCREPRPLISAGYGPALVFRATLPGSSTSSGSCSSSSWPGRRGGSCSVWRLRSCSDWPGPQPADVLAGFADRVVPSEAVGFDGLDRVEGRARSGPGPGSSLSSSSRSGRPSTVSARSRRRRGGSRRRRARSVPSASVRRWRFVGHDHKALRDLDEGRRVVLRALAGTGSPRSCSGMGRVRCGALRFDRSGVAGPARARVRGFAPGRPMCEGAPSGPRSGSATTSGSPTSSSSSRLPVEGKLRIRPTEIVVVPAGEVAARIGRAGDDRGARRGPGRRGEGPPRLRPLPGPRPGDPDPTLSHARRPLDELPGPVDVVGSSSRRVGREGRGGRAIRFGLDEWGRLSGPEEGVRPVAHEAHGRHPSEPPRVRSIVCFGAGRYRVEFEVVESPEIRALRGASRFEEFDVVAELDPILVDRWESVTVEGQA